MKKKSKTKSPDNHTQGIFPEEYEGLALTLVELLKNTSSPLKINEISKTLGIRSDSAQHEDLRLTLEILIQKGVVRKTTRRRYLLAALHDNTSFTGVVVFDYETSGSVETDSKEFPRIHIRRQDMATALHGDTVEVKLLALRPNKKPRGEVIRIIERNQAPVAGAVEYDGNFFFFVPDEDHYFFDFLIPLKKLNHAKPGDKVLAKFLRWDNPHQSPEAEILEVLGRAGDVRVEYDAIVKEFRLPTSFALSVEQEASDAARHSYDLSNRIDIREELVITIDPDDAKDFDDALSLRVLENGNRELGVHIADVSSYVQEGGALDREAAHRANSVYLVDRVIPMLPEVLSNNVCSLVPGQDRLTYSVFMEFSPRGVMKSSRIAETLIHSKRRFTYNEVQTIIESGKGDNAELIQELYTLAEQLRKRRYKEGGIDFDTSEVKFQLDENKNPIKALRKKRTDATGLVEECMLAANRAVTEHIVKQSRTWRMKNPLPFLYRIHDDPDTEKLRTAFNFIRALGIEVPTGKFSSKDINDLLLRLREVKEASIINQILLRAMAKAQYSAYNTGHYGLGFSNYTHFTSPIRRYPDVVVHRLLKEYARTKPDMHRIAQLTDYIDGVSDHCSLQERFAIDAERASQKLAQALMARQHIGADYEGTVTGITNYGVFVLVDELYAEGLVRIREMDGDYYYYDEKNYRLVGRKTKQVFGFGTRLRVQILNVNVDKREIDLRLVTTADPSLSTT